MKQGEVVGYVGSTGWSTAPHLDYRIKRNGKWVNPRKLDLPPADPVAEGRRPEFESRVAELERMLEQAPADHPNFVLTREPAPVPESVAAR